jgi:hypothetical protein
MIDTVCVSWPKIILYPPLSYPKCFIQHSVFSLFNYFVF